MFQKIKTICMTAMIATFALFVLSSCGLLKPLMSDKEIEDRLQELYGEEFVVVSSKSFPTDDAFRARVYVVSPKDEPEFTFYAYNFIEGETGGVPGVKRSLTETYAEKKIQTKFDEYATAEGLEYTSEYFVRLSNKKVVSEDSSDYYTNVVNTFTVTPETLDDVSHKLSVILNKILENEHFLESKSTRCGMKFFYVENGKEKNVRYFTLFAYGWDSTRHSYRPVDISEEGIKKLITGSIQDSNGLRQEPRNEDQANEQFPVDNHVIEWSDSALEELIRIGLDKPTGDITVGELSHIYGIQILGKEHIQFYDNTNLDEFEYSDKSYTNGQIKNINDLRYFKNLVSVQINYHKIDDVSAIANLTNLQALDLSNNEIQDISSLANLMKLKSVNLSFNKIADISPLANLTSLEYLNLYFNKITDISPLASLTKLQKLDLGVSKIENLSPLASLTDLKHLNLERTQISDINVLSNLTNLKVLYLWDNQITNIAPLENLSQLELLRLNTNQIADISPLAHLTSLKQLFLSENRIEDIRSIAKLTNLEYLDLSYNQYIKDISPLNHLQNLDELFLSGNSIVDWAPVAHIGAVNGRPQQRLRRCAEQEIVIEQLFPVLNDEFKMGYINSSGDTVIPITFDSAYPFAGNSAVVYLEQNGYFFIDQVGNPLFNEFYAEAYSFSCGRAVVKGIGEKYYKIIDKDGQSVSVLKNVIFADTSYKNNLLLVQFNDHMYGYVDLYGNEIFDIRFKRAESFSEGNAVVQIDGGFIGIMGTSGVIQQTSFRYNFLQSSEQNSFHEGLLGVQDDQGRWGFIKSDGSIAIDCKFNNVGIFSDGLAAVQVDTKYGYIDRYGNMIIPPQFDMAREFSFGIAAVIKMNNEIADGYPPNKVGFCDKMGQIVIDYIYSDFYSANSTVHTIAKCTQGVIPVWNYENDPWNGYITEQGEILYQNFLSNN